MDATGRLVEQAACGDRAAVTRLIEGHLPGLRAFVRLRMGADLRARESASDLVQSACREVLEHLDRFQYGGETQFRQWLYLTALRTVQKKHRYHAAAKRGGHRTQVMASATDGARDALTEFYQTLSTPSRRLVRREQIERFEAAFDQLPEDYREVITLARVVGLSHREIATAMQRSENATRTLLHRALAELADRLADEE